MGAVMGSTGWRTLVRGGLALSLAAALGCGSASKAKPGNDGGAGAGVDAAGLAGSSGGAGSAGSSGGAGRATAGAGGGRVDASAGASGDAGGADGGADAGAGGATPSGLFTPCAAMGVSQVTSLAYLPSGTGVVAGLGGAVAKLLSPADGHELRTFIGHAGRVNGVALSPAGDTLVTASDDHTVRLWRVSDGAALATLAGHGRELLSVAMSPDGASIAAGAADGEVFLWKRTTTWTLVGTATDQVDEVRGLGFAAGSARLFSASKDGSVRAYAAADLAPLASPAKGTSVLTTLAVSADGARVAVGDVNGGVTLLHADDATIERKLKADYGVTSLAFSPDGARVYAAYGDTSITAFPVDGSAPTLVLGTIGGDGRLAVSPDGHQIFFASARALWLVSDTGTHTPIPTDAFTTTIAFWPDGGRLAVGGGTGLAVRVIPGGSFAPGPDLGHPLGVARVAISANGSLVATAEGNGAFRVWQANLWQASAPLATASIRASGVAFSPDGTLVAVAGAMNVADVYRVDTQTLVHSLGQDGYVESVAFSPDGALVAVGTESRELGVLHTSDWSDARRVTDAPTGSFDDLAFSPDGRLLATAGAGHVFAWHPTGSDPPNELARLPSGLHNTVAFSSDGALLAAGGDDGQLRLWSAPDLAALPSLPAHGQGVVAVRFAPDGKKLAAAYADGTVWLWCR
jgi:WD40 repeat protein